MINYKNVYDLSEYEKAIFAAENKVRDAQGKVREAQLAYRAQCAKVAGAKLRSLSFPTRAA